jgi:hypothetical protein
MRAAVRQGMEAPGQKQEGLRVLSDGAALAACRSNKRVASHLFERFRGLLPSPRTWLLISSATYITTWFAPTSWSE